MELTGGFEETVEKQPELGKFHTGSEFNREVDPGLAVMDRHQSKGHAAKLHKQRQISHMKKTTTFQSALT